MYSLIFTATLLTLSTYCYANSQQPPRTVENKLSEQPLVYPIGANIVLKCPVETADPDSMFVEWTRNNEPVDEIGRFKITTRGHLKFNDADVTDSGVYTCKAINGFGFTKVNITLRVMQESELISMKSIIDNRYPKDNEFRHVESLPENEKVPSEYFTRTREVRTIEKFVGRHLKLKCHMSGIVNPQINWFKEGKTLNEMDLPLDSIIQGGILFISRLRLTDSGNYSCIAFNEFGQSKASFVVTVKEAKPELTVSELVNSPIKVGDSVTLQCRVVSESEPHIRWLKQFDKEAIRKLNREPILVDGDSYISLHSFNAIQDGKYYSKLKITNIQAADSGRYVCIAVNHLGYSYKTVYLSIASENDSSASNKKVLYNTSIPIALLWIVVIASAVIFALTLLLIKRNAKLNSKMKKPAQKAVLYPNNFCNSDQVTQWLSNKDEQHIVRMDSASNNESFRTQTTAITL